MAEEKTITITDIDSAAGNDVSALITMRYRLASDPDVDPSYTVVTATKILMGVTIPFFDTAILAPETYVLHTYFTADGTATGTKVTMEVGGGVLD